MTWINTGLEERVAFSPEFNQVYQPFFLMIVGWNPGAIIPVAHQNSLSLIPDLGKMNTYFVGITSIGLYIFLSNR